MERSQRRSGVGQGTGSDLPTLDSLVPVGSKPYLLAGLVGLVAIAVLDGLYLLGLRLAELTTDGSVAALNLDAEGSIACWLSVVLLLLAGQAALLLASLSRSAGYPAARVRAWLCVAALLCWMSLDEGASIHEGFKELMARLCGTRIIGDGSIYWVVPYAAALGLAGLFMFKVLRSDRPALACLLGWAVAQLLAVAAQLELILAGRWPLQIIVEEDAELAGYMLLLATLALYARGLVGQGPRVQSSSQKLGGRALVGRRHVPRPHLHAAQTAGATNGAET